MEVLECEVGFYNAGGFDPGSEDVLLSGLVVSSSNPIQAVQVAGDDNMRQSMDLGPATGSLLLKFMPATAFARFTVGPVSERGDNQETA